MSRRGTAARHGRVRQRAEDDRPRRGIRHDDQHAEEGAQIVTFTVSDLDGSITTATAPRWRVTPPHQERSEAEAGNDSVQRDSGHLHGRRSQRCGRRLQRNHQLGRRDQECGHSAARSGGGFAASGQHHHARDGARATMRVTVRDVGGHHDRDLDRQRVTPGAAAQPASGHADWSSGRR